MVPTVSNRARCCLSSNRELNIIIIYKIILHNYGQFHLNAILLTVDSSVKAVFVAVVCRCVHKRHRCAILSNVSWECHTKWPNSCTFGFRQMYVNIATRHTFFRKMPNKCYVRQESTSRATFLWRIARLSFGGSCPRKLLLPRWRKCSKWLRWQLPGISCFAGVDDEWCFFVRFIWTFFFSWYNYDDYLFNSQSG